MHDGSLMTSYERRDYFKKYPVELLNYILYIFPELDLFNDGSVKCMVRVNDDDDIKRNLVFELNIPFSEISFMKERASVFKKIINMYSYITVVPDKVGKNGELEYVAKHVKFPNKNILFTKENGSLFGSVDFIVDNVQNWGTFNFPTNIYFGCPISLAALAAIYSIVRNNRYVIDAGFTLGKNSLTVEEIIQKTKNILGDKRPAFNVRKFATQLHHSLNRWEGYSFRRLSFDQKLIEGVLNSYVMSNKKDTKRGTMLDAANRMFFFNEGVVDPDSRSFLPFGTYHRLPGKSGDGYNLLTENIGHVVKGDLVSVKSSPIGSLHNKLFYMKDFIAENSLGVQNPIAPIYRVEYIDRDEAVIKNSSGISYQIPINYFYGYFYRVNIIPNCSTVRIKNIALYRNIVNTATVEVLNEKTTLQDYMILNPDRSFAHLFSYENLVPKYMTAEEFFIVCNTKVDDSSANMYMWDRQSIYNTINESLRDHQYCVEVHPNFKVNQTTSIWEESCFRWPSVYWDDLIENTSPMKNRNLMYKYMFKRYVSTIQDDSGSIRTNLSDLLYKRIGSEDPQKAYQNRDKEYLLDRGIPAPYHHVGGESPILEYKYILKQIFSDDFVFEVEIDSDTAHKMLAMYK
jgi:hypothetical protein